MKGFFFLPLTKLGTYYLAGREQEANQIHVLLTLWEQAKEVAFVVRQEVSHRCC